MRQQIPMTAILWVVWLMQPALADAELIAVASEARAEVAPRGARRQVRLPQLDFSVRAKFACPDDAVAESVTISIADAHKRYAPNEDDNSLEAVVAVPANQIAPIATGSFCMDGNSGGEELLLAGVATAQLSLRCLNQTGRFVSFASLALPVRLVCKSDTDQDPSVGVPSPAR